ncbi:MAG: hypothetical protein B655_1385 [Methanobacterium sp. Maddingley MBC34]|nr:MAG: hypothetical protein B655_1385 [Methanobacterium sp. Maddingley MBC34]
MNKPIVLMIVILLIVGAIAVNKIINSSEPDNTQTTPDNAQVVSNPVQNNSNNTSSSNSPSTPKTNVLQK